MNDCASKYAQMNDEDLQLELELLRVTVDTLNTQLPEKDKQIAAKDEQIATLQLQLIIMSEFVTKQSLRLQQLTDSLSTADEPRKKHWWQKRRK